MTSLPQTLTGAQPCLPRQQQTQVTCGQAERCICLSDIVLACSSLTGQRADGIGRGNTLTWLLQRGGWQGKVVLAALMLRPAGSKKAHRLQQAGQACLVPSDASVLQPGFDCAVCRSEPHSWQLSDKDAAVLQLCWSAQALQQTRLQQM